MRSRFLWVFIFACRFSALKDGFTAQADNSNELLTGADARIEQIRKGDVTLRVTDSTGTPPRQRKFRWSSFDTPLCLVETVVPGDKEPGQ